MKESIRYLLSNLGEDNLNPKAWAQMKASTLDEQTQEMIFNKLTNNGEVQGFFVQDCQLYINAEFVRVLNLIAERLRTSSGGYTVRVQDGKITAVHDDEEGENLIELKCQDIDWRPGGLDYLGYVGSLIIRSLLKNTEGTSEARKAVSISPEAIDFSQDGESKLRIGNTAAWEYVESIGKEVLVREAEDV